MLKIVLKIGWQTTTTIILIVNNNNDGNNNKIHFNLLQQRLNLSN